MLRFFLFIWLIFMQMSFSQTHFTIPQNVWRISLNQNIFRADWKGHNGKNDWQKYLYNYGEVDYELFQTLRQTGRITKISIEYGNSHSTTVGIKIPYINNLEEKSSWTMKPDSGSADLENLLFKFYPQIKNNQGLDNISLFMNKLIIGTPAWSGKGQYSIFLGFEITLPFAERLQKFNNSHLDSTGRPLQFNQLPLGKGLTAWQGKIFGEFFHHFRQRLLNVTWSLHFKRFSRELVNSPVSFLWMEAETDPDSILTAVGLEMLFKQGSQVGASLSGQLELIPKRIFLTGSVNWKYAFEADYNSLSNIWDKWMVEKNYGSKNAQASQSLRFNFMNIDPLKKIGPLPFELEVGIRSFIPFLNKNSFAESEGWVKLSSYLQGW